MPGAAKIEQINLPDNSVVEIIPGSDTGDDSPVSEPSLMLFDNNKFQERVGIIMEAIKDEEKYRRCIAEIHTYLSLFEEGFRNMGEEMALNGGPFTFLRRMMGMGKASKNG